MSLVLLITGPCRSFSTSVRVGTQSSSAIIAGFGNRNICASHRSFIANLDGQCRSLPRSAKLIRAGDEAWPYYYMYKYYLFVGFNCAYYNIRYTYLYIHKSKGSNRIK